MGLTSDTAEGVEYLREESFELLGMLQVRFYTQYIVTVAESS